MEISESGQTYVVSFIDTSTRTVDPARLWLANIFIRMLSGRIGEFHCQGKKQTLIILLVVGRLMQSLFDR